MCSSTMTNLRSLHPIASSAAILPRHKLCFNVPGTAWIEPSWASVEPIEEDKNDINANVNTDTNTHGVLYKLTEEDFLRVCSSEGVPFGYTLHRCRVVPYMGNQERAGYHALQDQLIPIQDNDNITGNDNANDNGSTKSQEMTLARSVFAYTLRASRKEWREAKDIPPSRAYLNVLIRGAEEFQLDVDYLEYLKGIVPGDTIGGGIAELMLEAAEKRAGV